MSTSDAYWDIVWRQLKKNRLAYAALWVLLPLFLVALFAPALASNQPVVYLDGGEMLLPWLRALFNPEEVVDFAFNMALVGFFPWLLLATGLNWWWKRREVPGRRRAAYAVALYAAITALLIAVFSLPDFGAQAGQAQGAKRTFLFRPDNSYYARTFVEEQMHAPETTRGLYVLLPFAPTQQDLGAVFQPPMFRKPEDKREYVNDGFPHLLGTDDSGRDILVRMIYGTRVSLTVGFVAVGIYMAIGVVLGAVAGYFGGLADMTISRVIEVVLLFPSFFLILTLVGLIGPSIYIIMVVIGLTGWPMIARLLRGEVLKQREIDYVAAARALGSSNTRIIFRHILPNAIAPALVAVPFGVADAIITEASLSLLGFGVQPPAPSWGNILDLGHGNYVYWWLILVPSVAIFLTVTVFNLVGNGLRDAMDPRLRM